jgi:hypothetical protein
METEGPGSVQPLRPRPSLTAGRNRGIAAADGEGMTPFRPPHPPVLRPVMAHAERLSEVLLKCERDVTARDAGAIWLMGRAGELRCVAGVIAEDMRKGRLSPDQAAIDLAFHLKVLHEGFARIAGSRTPACCVEAAAPTPTMLLRDLIRSPDGDRR